MPKQSNSPVNRDPVAAFGIALGKAAHLKPLTRTLTLAIHLESQRPEDAKPQNEGPPTFGYVAVPPPLPTCGGCWTMIAVGVLG
jgi:hypothetical protein